MNPIERIRADLIRRFPGLAAEIDAPADDAGTWHLDVRPAGGSPWIVAEWRPGGVIGVSTPGPDDFGTRPDEVYPTAEEASGRIVGLIDAGGRTEPPSPARLAELRRARGLSQEELAGRAGVKQASISRIENRGDVLVSTLASIVGAMGAVLSIRARFPDGTEREIELAPPDLGARSEG